MSFAGLTHLFPLAAVRRPALALRKLMLPWGLAVLPSLGMACAQLVPSWDSSATVAPVVRASGADAMDRPPNYAAAMLPAVDSPVVAAPPMTPRSLAINLDTVFRLAEDQNVQV